MFTTRIQFQLACVLIGYLIDIFYITVSVSQVLIQNDEQILLELKHVPVSIILLEFEFAKLSTTE